MKLSLGHGSLNGKRVEIYTDHHHKTEDYIGRFLGFYQAADADGADVYALVLKDDGTIDTVFTHLIRINLESKAEEVMV